MWEKFLLSLLSEHRGKTFGVLLGLLASIVILTYGFWKALFIIGCITLGYFIGRKLDNNYNFNKWLQQIFKDKDH